MPFVNINIIRILIKVKAYSPCPSVDEGDNMRVGGDDSRRTRETRSLGVEDSLFLCIIHRNGDICGHTARLSSGL